MSHQIVETIFLNIFKVIRYVILLMLLLMALSLLMFSLIIILAGFAALGYIAYIIYSGYQEVTLNSFIQQLTQWFIDEPIYVTGTDTLTLSTGGARIIALFIVTCLIAISISIARTFIQTSMTLYRSATEMIKSLLSELCTPFMSKTNHA